MTVQETALSVSALLPRNNAGQFCAAVYVTAAEPIKRRGMFERPNTGRWSIKNNQRQMTSPSKTEHIKHLCGYSFLSLFFFATHFILLLLHTQTHTAHRRLYEQGLSHRLLGPASQQHQRLVQAICISTNDTAVIFCSVPTEHL